MDEVLLECDVGDELVAASGDGRLFCHQRLISLICRQSLNDKENPKEFKAVHEKEFSTEDYGGALAARPVFLPIF